MADRGAVRLEIVQSSEVLRMSVGDRLAVLVTGRGASRSGTSGT
jgi:hypothetical protein